MNKYPGNQLFRESWLKLTLANIPENSRILDYNISSSVITLTMWLKILGSMMVEE